MKTTDFFRPLLRMLGVLIMTAALAAPARAHWFTDSWLIGMESIQVEIYSVEGDLLIEPYLEHWWDGDFVVTLTCGNSGGVATASGKAFWIHELTSGPEPFYQTNTEPWYVISEGQPVSAYGNCAGSLKCSPDYLGEFGLWVVVEKVNGSTELGNAQRGNGDDHVFQANPAI